MKNKPFVATPPRSANRVPNQTEIAALAHALWVADGRPENHALDHWLAAERQLGGGAILHDEANRLTADAADPAASDAARTEIELERMVEPPARRSATSLG